MMKYRYDFTGTLIVVPNIAVLPGDSEEKPDSKHKGREQVEGIKGLIKAFGVRELNYKLAFFASSLEVKLHHCLLFFFKITFTLILFQKVLKIY